MSISFWIEERDNLSKTEKDPFLERVVSSLLNNRIQIRKEFNTSKINLPTQ